MVDLQKQIETYRQRFAAIQANRDLSPEGKAKQFAALDREKREFRQVAYNSITQEWNQIRGEYRLLAEQRRQAIEKDSQKWDYQRLNYEQAAVRARVATLNPGGGPAELRAEYERILKSGDAHQVRAWAEFVPALLTQKYPTADRLDLDRFSREARSDLEKILENPLLAPVQAAEAKLIERAVNLENLSGPVVVFLDQTQQAGDVISSAALRRATSDIHLSKRLVTDKPGEDPRFEYSLDID